ncbi:spore gernimation protein [Bacillus glycinifermentans]|uniref:spore germination protein n=1 Tax=Bacillus glycinifermentans TaxID=1664069 RepID=UPI0006531B11|nr:spore germination protein [Bacillus glycinifermentans]ATH91955.1 spore gernimation protein [Bacillus glycinifermentans]KMM60086.1 spore gernimation protein [Bacillus glycinifermentans]MEC0494899.1 spore germination protein [Bacillus glycinifermentans]MEC0540957.1 spore germination protein [Bacillus glycinifermentans]UOY89358.1 spore germination protein [Bacillus glycinifermentans]
MNSAYDKITTSQAIVVFVNYILAAGILSLPRTAVQEMGTPDVWLAVILGGMITMAAGIVMAKLSQGYPGKTFFEYGGAIVGKWMGILIGLFFIEHFITIAAFEARVMAEITSFFLLEGTPLWAITMTMMWVGLYSVKAGMGAIARLFEIIFPITVIIFLTVVFMSSGLFELDNLRPVLGKGVMPVLQGTKATVLSFTSAEVMLFLLAFMKKPQKGVKVVVVGLSISLIFYLVTVIFVIGALSVDGVVTRTWPTLDLMRSFEIPGLVFERFESMLLTIWIMQLFATFVISFYAASLGLSQLFHINITPVMYALLPVMYVIGMTPKNLNGVFQFGDFISRLAVILFCLLPIPLLMISKIRKKRAKSSATP